MKSILFGTNKRIEITDQKSYSKVYKIFWLTSVEFVRKMVKNREEAENITQDVFAQLWEKKESLSNIEDIKNFLFVCLRNKAFDYLREVKKSTIRNEEFWQNLQHQTDESDQVEIEQKNIEKLEAAIAELSIHKQKIINLKFDENKSYDEIGDLLSISTNTVKNHLVQIKKQLKSEVLGSIFAIIQMFI